jgi:hypothetical protein
MASLVLEASHLGEIRVDYQLANNSEEEWRPAEYEKSFSTCQTSHWLRIGESQISLCKVRTAVQPSVVGSSR